MYSRSADAPCRLERSWGFKEPVLCAAELSKRKGANVSVRVKA